VGVTYGVDSRNSPRYIKRSHSRVRPKKGLLIDINDDDLQDVLGDYPDSFEAKLDMEPNFENS
jgi:hypothetical protein